MKRLSHKTRRLGMHLEQVQDLTPTPMTLSSVMFYTGMDPYTGERLYVARSQDDKRRQKSWFFADGREEQEENFNSRNRNRTGEKSGIGKHDASHKQQTRGRDYPVQDRRRGQDRSKKNSGKGSKGGKHDK